MPKNTNSFNNNQSKNTNITGGNNNIYIINTEQLILHKREKRPEQVKNSNNSGGEHDLLQPGSIYQFQNEYFNRQLSNVDSQKFTARFYFNESPCSSYDTAKFKKQSMILNRKSTTAKNINSIQNQIGFVSMANSIENDSNFKGVVRAFNNNNKKKTNTNSLIASQEMMVMGSVQRWNQNQTFHDQGQDNGKKRVSQVASPTDNGQNKSFYDIVADFQNDTDN